MRCTITSTPSDVRSRNSGLVWSILAGGSSRYRIKKTRCGLVVVPQMNFPDSVPYHIVPERILQVIVEQHISVTPSSARPSGEGPDRGCCCFQFSKLLP
jgi:hypothetical protein